MRRTSTGRSSVELFLSVASAVIGGASLTRGQGTAPSTLGGLLLMSGATNAINLPQIPAEFINVVSGAVVLFAVFVDSLHLRAQ